MARKPRKPKRPEPAGRITDAGGKLVARATGRRKDVPGPSENFATNLVIQDIAMRASGRLIRQAFEKGMLRGRYGGTGAKAIVENRSLAHIFVSSMLARYATRSVPGAVIVGGGLLAKTLYDRGRSKRAARRAGDKALKHMAED